jgi:hypothetical protein
MRRCSRASFCGAYREQRELKEVGEPGAPLLMRRIAHGHGARYAIHHARTLSMRAVQPQGPPRVPLTSQSGTTRVGDTAARDTAMSGLAYFKFKSALTYDSVAFDGVFITVAELKRSIKEKKGLKDELALINAHTNEGTSRVQSHHCPQSAKP